jgi:hypothetical protein
VAFPLAIFVLHVLAANPSPATSGAKIAPSEIVGTITPKQLVAGLRQGGLILWMRHGERDSRSGDVSDAQAVEHNCAEQSALTEVGVAQARAVGEGIRSLKLPIGTVYAARLCRTQITAESLGLGPVILDSRLDEATTWTDRGGDAAYESAIIGLISAAPPVGQNIVEVTSQLTTKDPQPSVLAVTGAAETVVFRPKLGGSAEVVARIGRDAWPALLRLAE